MLETVEECCNLVELFQQCLAMAGDNYVLGSRIVSLGHGGESSASFSSVLLPSLAKDSLNSPN